MRPRHLVSLVLLLAACGGSGGSTIPQATDALPVEGSPPSEATSTATSSPDAAPPAQPDASTPAMPLALKCIASHYVGTPARRGSSWVLVLPDGAELAWND